MTPAADPERYKNHRFPGEIISHGVWLYYRFPLSYRVAYPRSAGNVLRLLPFRLRRVHQAVVGSQIHFSAPHGTLLARLRRTCPASLHDHRLRQPVTLPEAAATVARDRGEPLSATTRDPSSPPPSPVCTAATT
jgi:hypothetical protein